MVGISEAKSKKQLKLFEQLPELIHKDDPFFVPPFPGSIVKIIEPKGNFPSKHGEVHCFIAEKDGKPVGRIAAIVNRSHNKYHNDKAGFFGYFDLIDDVEVGQALIKAARQRLKERGLDSMMGPFNPSSNDEAGVLVEGFNSSPFIMMPYNPPYYISLYEKLGLKPLRNLLAFYMNAELEAPERIKKIVDRVRKNSQMNLRAINMKKLDEELKIIHHLYNLTLDRNWGFIPITLGDLQDFAKDLKSIADPSMILIAEKHGQPVGFSLCLPNINEALWKAKKSKGLVRLMKFLWHLKVKKPREARLIILGVHPDYRTSALGSLFCYESLMRGKKGRYIGGECSWVEENNEEIIKPILLMGAKPYKKYRIYEAPMVNA